MDKKILWVVVSSLMALSLVMAACGPAAEEEEGEVKEEAEVVSPETPQYGGILTLITASEPTLTNSRGWPVYEQFMGPDWTRGAAGIGLADFNAGASSLEDWMGPILAESWVMTDPSVWVLNIRRGVYWQPLDTEAGRLMGGREMTADDVVNSFNWQIKESPESWIWRAQPLEAEASTIEKTGPWQVTIKTPSNYMMSFGWIIQGAGFHRVYPYDVVKAFDHELIYRAEGWHYTEAVGTGPFMIEEVVAGTSRTFKRNPLYWDKDPLGAGKGNQLPYLDGYMELYITDRSTQLAAMRTGQVAYTTALTKDDWEREIELSPDLEWASYLSAFPLVRFIHMRTDKAPFNDVRVRQALMMATDFEAFVGDYYGGAAEMDVWPWDSNFAGSGYVPLDEMPQSVQELFRYNPEKAKELLTEAGYPGGFKTSIIVSAAGNGVDEIAIFKDMWAKVGIEVEINVREASIYSGIWAQRAHEDMIYAFNATNWPWIFTFGFMRGGNTFNSSYVNDPEGSDPILEAAYEAVNENIIWNMPEVYRLMEEIRTYIMEQSYVIPRPSPYMYNVWQPWLKNYYGFNASQNKYFWIDQALKEEMGQ